jgi:membrane-bound inhibitor of C-type lysozyme
MVLFRACVGAAIAAVAFAAAASAASAYYVCSGGTRLTADFSPPSGSNGYAALNFDSGRRVTLTQAMSADGGRYVRGDVEFWIKGRRATLTDGGRRETCLTQ